MFSFKSCVLLLAASVYNIVSGDDLQFSNADEFYDFYDAFTKTKDPETFRATQTKWITQMLDLSADPCEDFYEFACGNVKTVVPKNISWESVSVIAMVKHFMAEKQAKLWQTDVVESDSEVSKKLKTFYQLCIDDTAWKTSVVDEFLKNFGTWPILHEETDDGKQLDWVDPVARMAQYQFTTLFLSVVGDYNGAYVAEFRKGEDIEMDVAEIKESAKKLSIDLEGRDNELSEVRELQGKLIALQNERNHGKRQFLNVSTLETRYPSVQFRLHLQVLRGSEKAVSLSENVVLYHPTYFEKLNEILSQTQPKVLMNHIFTQLMKNMLYVRNRASYSTKEGYCRRTVGETLKEAIYGLFAQHYFSEDSLNMAVEMVDELQAATGKLISDSEWLVDNVKEKALEKLNAIKKSVALPPECMDPTLLSDLYKDFVVVSDDFFTSFLSLIKVNTQIQQKNIGKPKEITDPLDVGAYFKEEEGLFQVPVGILQPPFYHVFSPQFVNYGSAGSITGHEFMHGYDIKGIRFDANNVEDTWLPEEIKQIIIERGDCFIELYDSYEYDTNKTVNGSLTIRENIADNDGLRVSLIGYRKWLENHREETNIAVKGEDLTPVQAFFLAFAQSQCTTDFEEAHGLHSPKRVRVRATLANTPAFSEAYKCPLGSKMNPEFKCQYL